MPYERITFPPLDWISAIPDHDFFDFKHHTNHHDNNDSQQTYVTLQQMFENTFADYFAADVAFGAPVIH